MIKAVSEKELAAMFTVGEFSQLAQVSKWVLRYYDEIGLLKPIRTDPRSQAIAITAQSHCPVKLHPRSQGVELIA